MSIQYKKKYEGYLNIKNRTTICTIKLAPQCLYKIIKIQIVKDVCAPTFTEAFFTISKQIETIQCLLTG